MKKLSKISSAIIMSTALSACTDGFKATQVDIELQKPIQANAAAKNYRDWHMSQDSPDKIVATLIQQYMAKEITSGEICQGFEKLSVHDLTLYEEKIHDKTYEILFRDCQESLVDKLETYWNEQRKLLNIPLKKTNLDPEIVEDKSLLRRFETIARVARDVSQGYVAVTGDLLPGQVALTFDDGPHAEYTYQVLQALQDANVKATFFVMGNNARKNPDALKAEAQAGHSIGSHTNDHLCQTDTDYCQKSNGGKRLTVEDAIEDMLLGHKAVKDILGWVFPFFRFPYGEGSKPLKEFLKKSGTGEFFWSVDSNDWRNYVGSEKRPYTTVDMVESVKKALLEKRRGIVLNHDIQKKTAVGLPAILNFLYEQGLQPVAFIPLDQKSITDSGLIKAAEALTQTQSTVQK